MSNPSNNPNNIAFTSQCIPGSVAAQKEEERIAQFQRDKVRRKAEEEGAKPLQEAQRQQDFNAHKDRLHKGRITHYHIPRT